jgi:glutathione S-transferase
MALTLYYHPLASFCHKVLIALYENDTRFSGQIVDLMDEAASARLFAMWPVGKIPVLADDSQNRTIPETSIIIEYLDQHYPGPRPLLPTGDGARLDARLWDRFFDLYVQVPMQKIVIDRLRGEGEHDPRGVAEARASLVTAYDVLERQMAGKSWAIGEDFTIADCAAAPALFYAGIVVPFSQSHPNVDAYFMRLLARPSFKRVIAEARPYFQFYPFKDEMPTYLLQAGSPTT